MNDDPTRLFPLRDDGHDETARLLRRALTQEAEMIQPDDRLGAITQETDAERRPRWVPVLTAVAGVAAAGLVAAVALGLGGGDDVASPASTSGSPTASATAEPTPSAAPSSPSASPTDGQPPPSPTATESASAEPPPGPPLGEALPVYWVGEQGSRFALFREFGADGPDDAAGRVQAAVDAALGGSPADPDYTSPWPDDAAATTSLSGDEIAVDLSSSAVEGASVGSELAVVMVQQLVWTATAAALQDVPVRFTVDGEAADLFGTVSTAEPIRRGAGPDDPRALVWITNPVEGAAVSADAPKIRGEGVNAYENTLTWRLERDGAVVEEGFFGVTGQGGEPVDLGERGSWAFEPEQELTTGSYTLTVEVPDASDGETAVRSFDSKTFTVG